MADRRRAEPPRGVHAQLAPPRRVPVLQVKANASLTPSSSCHFPLCRPPRERGDREDRDRRRAKSPKPSAIVRFT
jgi:hypothetical protein